MLPSLDFVFWLRQIDDLDHRTASCSWDSRRWRSPVDHGGVPAAKTPHPTDLRVRLVAERLV
jgi:hypothetical protein